MRVIAGSAKGIKLESVPGDTTRPILDRVKTALFDILRPELEGKSFLDLFAGSGAVGIEALSQGAKNAVFIDIESKAVETIRGNLHKTKLKDHAEIRSTDSFLYLKNTKKIFDYIFVAPPQYKALWLRAVQLINERPEILSPEGKVIVQIDPREYEELALSDLVEVSSKKYGNTLLNFYTKML